ncbi:MAG TPA: hypothetical protein PKH32_14645, partial [Verrucomicrobiota bacterium]|nr:hypothetical protein [Verrucomicrobiota bacterium]
MSRQSPGFVLVFALVCCSGLESVLADGPYRNRDNRSVYDLSEGTYPIPYQMPRREEIVEVLQRIRG